MLVIVNMANKLMVILSLVLAAVAVVDVSVAGGVREQDQEQEATVRSDIIIGGDMSLLLSRRGVRGNDSGSEARSHQRHRRHLRPLKLETHKGNNENENEDEDENENENENNENVENHANNEEADREVGINNETKKNKQNNTSLGDNISFTAMFTCVGVLVVAWAWAAVMLGAGISRYSLRLQQMHARTQEQQEDILPISFFSGLFNMRHFICGIWLLDLFFCLHSNGLSTMHGWSRMFDEAKETMVAPRPDASDRSEKSLLLIWKGFMKSLGVMAFKVGSVGTMLLTFLEIDRMAEYSGDIVWYGTCIPVAYCLLGVLQVVYSWRTQVRVSMVSFHNRLRDTKYGSGSQLQNRPANK
jgi:hypothetical protein